MPLNRPRRLPRALIFAVVGMLMITSHAQSADDRESGSAAEPFPSLTLQSMEPQSVGQPFVLPGLLTTGGGKSSESGIALTGFQSACDDCDACATGGCCSACGGCCNSCLCPLPTAPCQDCPRISTQSPYFNINVFGALKLDMLFNEARPISPGTPFFLSPKSNMGFDEQTFDAHARQSMLGASLVGPQFGGFQSGGTAMAVFYNDAIIVDQYGFLPLQAYGELKNSDWRFSAGLQFDVFAPGAPTVLPFSVLNASGNAGNSFRGQVRLERFLQTSADRQWTLQLALSEPISSTIDPSFRLAEDNGWPNVEGRVALGCGGLDATTGRRPFEFGLSGVLGQLRTTILNTAQHVTDVWGLNADFYWKINDTFGFTGEVFTGEAIGIYNAGIFQGINKATFDGIRTSGGWIESFVYWTPCLHSHLGFGVDDPRDSDVDPVGRLKNETYFANLIWDVNSTFRIGGELAWRETDYNLLSDNEGIGFHTQFQWTF
ncbi:MAG: hypothetical protein ACR2NZ_17465 [Rubripirellula sp.]